MLVELFELKCRQLQDEVFNLLEEKLHKRGIIQKEAKDKLDQVQQLQQDCKDPEMKEKLQKIAEKLKQDEAKDLQNLEWEYKAKEQHVEANVTGRLIDKENQRLLWLKEQQLQEKKEIYALHLSDQHSALKEMLQKLTDEEQTELEEFKREQEADKIQKMRELEQQQKLINSEIQQQRDRLNKMDALNQALQKEDERRERDKQSSMRRKRLQDSNMNSEAYIDKLKKDLERINAQLDSALGQEKQRQLQNMQNALRQKMEDAERTRQEELEQLRQLEEAEKRRLEEEEEQKKAEEFALYQMRDRVEKAKQMIDKKKYCGHKLEEKTHYYEAFMRRKEKQQILRLQQRMKSSKMADALNANFLKSLNTQGPQSHVVEGLNEPTISKEKQLRMLNEILNKIESLESQVKGELYTLRPRLANNQYLSANNLANKSMIGSSGQKVSKSKFSGSVHGGLQR
eukprot:403333008